MSWELLGERWHIPFLRPPPSILPYVGLHLSCVSESTPGRRLSRFTLWLSCLPPGDNDNTIAGSSKDTESMLEVWEGDLIGAATLTSSRDWTFRDSRRPGRCWLTGGCWLPGGCRGALLCSPYTGLVGFCSARLTLASADSLLPADWELLRDGSTTRFLDSTFFPRSSLHIRLASSAVVSTWAKLQHKQPAAQRSHDVKD